MIRVLKNAAAALAAFFMSGPAYSGAVSHPGGACMPTKTVQKLLANRYGEYPAVIGTTQQGRVLVFYANPVKRSWTIVVFTRTGLGCLLKSGVGLRFGKPKPKGKPA